MIRTPKHLLAISVVLVLGGLFFRGYLFDNPARVPGAQIQSPASPDDRADFIQAQKKNAERKIAALPPARIEHTPVKTIKDFKRKFGDEWTIKESPEGQVRWIYGSDIKLENTSPEAVTQFVQEIVPVLGLESRDLGPMTDIVGGGPSVPTDHGTRIYSFEQKFKGYDVVGGGIRVGVDLGAQTIFSIQVGKPIAPDAVLNTQHASFESIKKKVENSTHLALIQPVSKDPKVLVLPQKSPQLVFVLSESPSPLDKGPKAKVIYVDSQSGKVVHEHLAGYVD